MKFKIMFSAGLLALATGAVFAQNRSNGAILTTVPASPQLGSNFEAFRFRPGIVTQLDLGSDFDFTSSSQWSSLGRISTPGQTLYGLRVQRAGRGLLFGYSGALQSTTPTLGTPVIQWVGANGISAGDLLFRTSASSTSATSTQVLKLRADATAVLATVSKYENNAILQYPGFNNDRDFYPSPKLEINQVESEGLSVATDNATNEFGRGAIFINRNTFANGVSVGSGSYSVSAGGYSYALSTRATSSVANSGVTYGLFTEANSGASNFGVYSRVSGQGSSGNIGLYATVSGSSTGGSNYGVYGYATGSNAFAGYFSGRIFSTNALVVSDKSLKTDVKKEENTLEKLGKLNPVNYTFIKQDREMNMSLPTTLQHGFIAQELEEVYPELVEEVTHAIFDDKGKITGSKTLKGVNYIGLVSVLTQSIKELNEEVKSLKEQVANNSKTYVVGNTNALSSDQLKDVVANGYYLGQNLPNPFSEFTKIEYSLPENESDASIWIMNLSGQIIKEYKLTDAKGSITISAGALEKGIYLYSLIGSGQEIISKKMVVK